MQGQPSISLGFSFNTIQEIWDLVVFSCLAHGSLRRVPLVAWMILALVGMSVLVAVTGSFHVGDDLISRPRLLPLLHRLFSQPQLQRFQLTVLFLLFSVGV